MYQPYNFSFNYTLTNDNINGFQFLCPFKEGARIAIYSPTSYDNVDGNGIDLPTKTLTSLALERVNFEKPYCCVLYKRVIFNTNSMFNIILMKFHTI